MVVNADEKWIDNTARLLGKSLSYTQREARWMGFVRMFTQQVGVNLTRSAALASEAMRYPEGTREARLGETSSNAATITVDLARFYSAHNAAMSAALTLGGSRKRGRPPAAGKKSDRASFTLRERSAHETVWDVLARAKAYGVDLSSLRDGLSETPAKRLERLDNNSRFIGAMRKATETKPRKRSRHHRDDP